MIDDKDIATSEMEIKAPEGITADRLWKILGDYANTVGNAEGVLFTDHPLVLKAVEDFDKSLAARS